MRDYLDTRPIKLRAEHLSLPTSRRPFVLALLLGLIAGSLLFLDRQGLLAPARTVFQETISPVAQRLTRLRDSAADFWAGIQHIHHLREENAYLREQIGDLRADLIARERVLVENTWLRQQLSIQSRQPWELVGAEVVVNSPDAGRRVMTIACGYEEGVRVGMAVIGQTDMEPAALVGIVEEVAPHTAKVLLMTDSGCQVSARVLHDGTSTLGLVQGQWQLGSRLRLEQLDREIPLTIGQVVVTAGLTSVLMLPLPMSYVPDGIPIGTIETLLESDDLTQFAELRPYVDPDQVRYVWIVLNHGD
ncbi:MAG: rod shape-determining protein MreC [Chloroflexaceae bacterium]|nr:rod shape-determining protein MreC [Chloroflexaceae bacterium]